MAEKISFQKVTAEYYDVLKELGNIGAGNATTALAQMLQCKVDMHVPQVRLLNFSEVGEVMGGEEQIVAGIYLAVEGDITGSMMFILEQNAGKALVSKLMGTPMADGEFNEIEISAMKEIGNIIFLTDTVDFSHNIHLKLLDSFLSRSFLILCALLILALVILLLKLGLRALIVSAVKYCVVLIVVAIVILRKVDVGGSGIYHTGLTGTLAFHALFDLRLGLGSDGSTVVSGVLVTGSGVTLGSLLIVLTEGALLLTAVLCGVLGWLLYKALRNTKIF